MKIFLKLLPYLIIITLGISLFCGFKYMTNKLSESETQKQILIMQNAEIKNQMETTNELMQSSLEQIERMKKNEKQSLNNINKHNAEINSLELSEDRRVVLEKINAYENCMAMNSLNPYKKCEINLK